MIDFKIPTPGYSAPDSGFGGLCEPMIKAAGHAMQAPSALHAPA